MRPLTRLTVLAVFLVGSGTALAQTSVVVAASAPAKYNLWKSEASPSGWVHAGTANDSTLPASEDALKHAGYSRVECGSAPPEGMKVYTVCPINICPDNNCDFSANNCPTDDPRKTYLPPPSSPRCRPCPLTCTPCERSRLFPIFRRCR